MSDNVGRTPFYPNNIQVRLLDIVDRENVKVQVYERNNTLASTEGCSFAALMTAYKCGLLEGKITVHTSNGDVHVEMNTDGLVHIEGDGKDKTSVVATTKFLNELKKFR